MEEANLPCLAFQLAFSRPTWLAMMKKQFKMGSSGHLQADLH